MAAKRITKQIIVDNENNIRVGYFRSQTETEMTVRLLDNSIVTVSNDRVFNNFTSAQEFRATQSEPNEEQAKAKAMDARTIKLSETQTDIISTLAHVKGGGNRRVFLHNMLPKGTRDAMVKKGLITVSLSDNGYYVTAELTDAGREYATAQGWLPANSEAAPASVEAARGEQVTGDASVLADITQLSPSQHENIDMKPDERFAAEQAGWNVKWAGGTEGHDIWYAIAPDGSKTAIHASYMMTWQIIVNGIRQQPHTESAPTPAACASAVGVVSPRPTWQIIDASDGEHLGAYDEVVSTELKFYHRYTGYLIDGQAADEPSLECAKCGAYYFHDLGGKSLCGDCLEELATTNATLTSALQAASVEAARLRSVLEAALAIQPVTALEVVSQAYGTGYNVALNRIQTILLAAKETPAANS